MTPNAPIPGEVGGRRRGIGQGFDQLLQPGGRAFELFEFLFVPMSTNHFPGWGISVIFELTFFPEVENFTAIFRKMSNPRPMPRLSPKPPPLIGMLYLQPQISYERSQNSIPCQQTMELIAG